ncbi:GNAT family protein [Candidatus Igneacidithiobacillus taiwanensis]|uniref:GNAT family N-acetyltransferase n=1 Tax=Candidatus Igneacidithiobacillus taiwanensis TaxID=1945924 RepID=UPI002897F1CD|nr:GNAT family protein [Candidatus Igneacidithiobacillus taiwanensis]MCE5360837.1 GNAT family N-acetyltransferase [Acidithiobacillus sp.]
MRLVLEKSLIRDWQLDDCTNLATVANNKNIWRNLADRFPHPYTLEDANSWISLLLQQPEPSHWAIVVNNHIAGAIGVDLGEGIFAKTGHIGFWLGESFWGRGIMSENVPIISQYALQKFGLTRLETGVFGWNPASMRVLEKSGFVREAVLKNRIYKDGKITDHVLYGLVV